MSKKQPRTPPAVEAWDGRCYRCEEDLSELKDPRVCPGCGYSDGIPRKASPPVAPAEDRSLAPLLKPKRNSGHNGGRNSPRGGPTVQVNTRLLRVDAERLQAAAKARGKAFGAFIGDILEHSAKSY